MKLIIYWYEYIKTIDKPIVYYDYPRYSVFWYIVSVAYQGYITVYIVLNGIHLSVQFKVFADLYDSGLAHSRFLLFRALAAICCTDLTQIIFPGRTQK
jgi:hypothetical protein